MTLTTKIFSILLVVLGLISASASYYNYFIVENYSIITEIECDPENQNCFLEEADDGTISNVSLLKFHAPAALECDITTNECQEKICQSSGASCVIITCADKTEFMDKFKACSHSPNG